MASARASVMVSFYLQLWSYSTPSGSWHTPSSRQPSPSPAKSISSLSHLPTESITSLVMIKSREKVSHTQVTNLLISCL